MTQLIITRRGIVDINDVTVNDEVYTIRRRWRKVTDIKVQESTFVAKTKYSFYTNIGKNQRLPKFTHTKDQIPYVVPRGKVLDSNNKNYWFNIGKSLSQIKTSFNPDSLFFLPINVILMDNNKCKEFLQGFFSSKINYLSLPKRVRLGMSFMLVKLLKGHEYRSTYLVSRKIFKTKKTLIKILRVEEDESYCINGLYVQNIT